MNEREPYKHKGSLGQALETMKSESIEWTEMSIDGRDHHQYKGIEWALSPNLSRLQFDEAQLCA